MPDAPTAGFDDGLPHFEPKPTTDFPFESLLATILSSTTQDELSLRGSDFHSITNMQMNEYVTKEAKLGQSLISEAIHRLSYYLPGNISPDVISQKMDDITPEDEFKIRMFAAGISQTIFHQLEDISGVRRFSSEVYTRLGLLEIHAGGEGATSLNISNIVNVESILVQAPQILKKGMSHMFAFSNPDSPGEAIEDFYLVTSEKRNSELSQLLLDSPQLLKFYVARYIFDIQKTAINTIHEKLSSVHNILHTQASELTQSANAETQDHFYMLLFKESEQKPIRMNRIQRVDLDSQDSTENDALPTIAYIHSYTVTKSGPDEIMIEQYNTQARKKKDKKIHIKPKNFIDRLFLQITPEGTYRFGRQDTSSNTMIWADTLVNLEGSRIKTFLQFPTVITNPSDLYHVKERTQLLADAKASTKRIQATGSLLECIQQIHAERLAHYPSSEMVLEQDVTTLTPPKLDTIKNN